MGTLYCNERIWRFDIERRKIQSAGCNEVCDGCL